MKQIIVDEMIMVDELDLCPRCGAYWQCDCPAPPAPLLTKEGLRAIVDRLVTPGDLEKIAAIIESEVRRNG